jgi:hypothetical protein
MLVRQLVPEDAQIELVLCQRSILIEWEEKLAEYDEEYDQENQ